MAYITTQVSHSCGHTGEVKHGTGPKGKQKLAEKTAGVCFDCQKQEDFKAAVLQQTQNQMAPLTGSDAQVMWGTTLRWKEIMAGTAPTDDGTNPAMRTARYWIDRKTSKRGGGSGWHRRPTPQIPAGARVNPVPPVTTTAPTPAPVAPTPTPAPAAPQEALTLIKTVQDALLMKADQLDTEDVIDLSEDLRRAIELLTH